MKIEAIKRLKDKQLRATNEDLQREAGKTVEYFESIFGNRNKKGNIELKNGEGVVYFKDYKKGKCLVSNINLELYKGNLTFNCTIGTPYIDKTQSSKLYIEVSGQTAKELIQKYKKEVGEIIEGQENALDEISTSVDFIKKLI